MIEDMQLRKLAPKTQTSYIRAVKKLADYMDHSPDTATAEDLRQFQLHLTDKGTSRITINATITALRFFFDVTVGDKEVAGKLNTVPVPRKLPVVLSREEVARLLEATSSLKYKAAFAVAYGAGLRISEVASLKISDIDSERMTLHVEQGKGRKDRYAMLSPVLRPGPGQPVKHPAAFPRHSGRRGFGRDRQARLDAPVKALLCHSPARAEG
jgi:site-specific recombinase XerD